MVSGSGMTHPRPRVRPRLRTRLLWGCPWLVCLVTGCATASWDWLPWKKNDAAPPTTLQDTASSRDRVADSALEADMDAARQMFQQKEYRKAEVVFHKIAGNKKAPLNIIDEALYHEGECQRLQNNLRDAEGTLRKYVKEFRVSGQYVESANRRLFDIANYWLDDTRQQMAAWEEKREGKRWFIMPSSYIHFTRDKPLLDMEGHALQLLEDVGLNDIRGSIRTVDGGPSLGERALFFLATVKFYREDYREADYYYSQVYENHPNSTLASKAIKQSIICKQIMNGGTAYDTRALEESRKLIDRYQGGYPEWNKDREWLTRQLGSIHLQQADRDLKIGEFYRRTGHPGSAYFYYELVRRRYPNTDYAKTGRGTHARPARPGRAGPERRDGQERAVTRESPNAFTTPAAPAPQPPIPPAKFLPPPTTAPALPPLPALPNTSPPNSLPPNPLPPSTISPPPLIPASAPPSATFQPPAPVPIGPSITPPNVAPRLLPPAGIPGGN